MINLFLRTATIVGAILGIFAMINVMRVQAGLEAPMATEPPVAPAAKPSPGAIAATGILEALGENVSIGVPMAGLVTEVLVEVNDKVTKDQPLLRLDSRDLEAQRIEQQSMVAVAVDNVALQEATLVKLEEQLKRFESAASSNAVSAEDVENRRNDVIISKAQLSSRKSEVAAAEAALKSTALLIDRLTVRAPRDGTVLQVNIRAGEFAAVGGSEPPMVIGEISRLQVRADVDEQNASRIVPGQPAVATLKGDASVSLPLDFLRIEPYVIPKVSLTGASTERVDTRVLQVIFSLRRPESPPVYVGQQVDVYIGGEDSPM